jgi:hypothetical protein
MTPKSEIDVAGTFLWPNCDVNGSRHLNTQCRGGSCWSNFLLSFYYLHGGVAPPNPNKGMVVVTIKATWGSRWANSQQTNGSRREKKKPMNFYYISRESPTQIVNLNPQLCLSTSAINYHAQKPHAHTPKTRQRLPINLKHQQSTLKPPKKHV